MQHTVQQKQLSQDNHANAISVELHCSANAKV